jgi:hypothetical protein
MFILSHRLKIGLIISIVLIVLIVVILLFIFHKPSTLKTRYNCDNGECLESESGQYGDAPSCRAECDTYMCSGSPKFQCIKATGDDYPGPYVSMESCQSKCTAPMYKCSDTPGQSCVQDPSGTHPDPVACKTACMPNKYKCDVTGGGGCQSTSDQGAPYSTQSQCQAGCQWSCGTDTSTGSPACSPCGGDNPACSPSHAGYYTQSSCQTSCAKQPCCFYKCDTTLGCVPATVEGGAEYTTLTACQTQCGGPGPGPGGCPSDTNCYLITPGVSGDGLVGYVNATAKWKPGLPVITSLGSVDSAVYNCGTTKSVNAQLNWAYWDPAEKMFNFEIFNTGSCPHEFGVPSTITSPPDTKSVITLTAIQGTNTASVDTYTFNTGLDNTQMVVSDVASGRGGPDFQNFLSIVTGTTPYTLQSSFTASTNVSSLYGY